MFSKRNLTGLLLMAGLMLGLKAPLSAIDISIYLKTGKIVRGEIVDRSTEGVTVRTTSGQVKVAPADMMDISRQQLRFPNSQSAGEGQAEVKTDSDTEVLIKQLEQLLAENESLKKEIAALKQQYAGKKTQGETSTDVPSPAEGPVGGKR